MSVVHKKLRLSLTKMSGTIYLDIHLIKVVTFALHKKNDAFALIP